MTFRLFVAGLAALCILLSYVADHLSVDREWDFKSPESTDSIFVVSADYAFTPHKGETYRSVTMDGVSVLATDSAGKTRRVGTMHRVVGWRQGDDVRRLFTL